MESINKMTTSKIAILLATYNGENYLTQQINSILNQTHKDWVLYIRDDGSKDSTLSLIEEYQNKYSKIILLNDSKKHRGAKDSFIWMMENIESEYYMFCDQDDIWLDSKIEESYSELLLMENKNSEIPSLVFTDLFVVDSSLNIISNSMWDYTRLNRVMDFKYLLIGPLTTGCTMIFNNSARLCSLKFKNKAMMHDSLLTLSVFLNGGKLKGISSSLIYYRQHGNNTLGTSKFNKSIIYRLSNLKEIIIMNYNYFKFVNTITNLSFTKFLLLKLDAGLRIRNISLVKYPNN